MATAKKPAAKTTKAKAAAPAGEKQQLLAALAEELGLDQAGVELRALRELAGRHGVGGGSDAKAAPEKQRAAPEKPAKAGKGKARDERPGMLPRRLFVLLDGRGLDGRGLPIEVLQSPTVIGSGRMCTIWVNSPQIETRHLQLTDEEGGWVLTDLKTEKGTLFDEEPIKRRELEDGDEFKLAGYLRMRVEIR